MTAAERAEREKSWATRVHLRRRELGITQAQLATICGVTQQALSRIERGQVVPRLRTMQSIAGGLGTSMEALFPMSSAPRPDRVAS